MTLYVSLPVHEAPLVVADQLGNFARYLPEATVVLHLSRGGVLTPSPLDAALRQAGHRNYLINPNREQTAWGGIFRAHLVNIAFIRALGDATHICFHASNDMLVRPGLAGHIAREGRGYNLRPVTPRSYWWVARRALRDKTLHAFLASFGERPALFGSQIEGAFFDAGTIFEIAVLAERAGLGEASYPQEEIVIPTLAHALGARAATTPYVFSETHVFDRAYWGFLQRFEWLFGNNWSRAAQLRHCIEYAFIKTPFYKLSPALVEAIALGPDQDGEIASATRQGPGDALRRLEWMNDGDTRWRVFDRQALYGVKRVPRVLDNPLRQFIRQLPLRAGKHDPYRTSIT
jgi:hypothetical protein